MLINSGFALLLLIATITSVQAYPPVTYNSDSRSLDSRATVCNGQAGFCTRSFGNLTFIGSHNSYAIGTTVSTNQDQTVMQQLNDGIRMLQMQAHNSSGVIRLCHSSCVIYDGGTLEDYLKIVKQWLDANPNEVLSLLIVNIDNLPATSYATVFKSVGLDTMSYAPSTLPLPASDWPTLGSLIDSGKRLITFLDNTANPDTVPYLIDEFSNVWETAYNVIDPAFDCAPNRTRGDTSTQLYLINHFLDTPILGGFIPAIGKLDQTNAASGYGSVGAQVATCIADHGRPPNFILVDYYEYGAGAVFQVAAGINGVRYSPTSPIAVPAATASTTATATPSPHRASASIAVVSNQLIAFINFIAGAAIFIGPLIIS